MMQTSASAFDGLAEGYDADFTASALGRVLRAMVWERFERSFTGRERLLDIGCGTGEDAIHLAARGHRVYATDASEQMVRVARHKAERAGLAHRLEFRCVAMENLGAELAGRTFDGVYSNFGAVNCAARLDSLAASLAACLPGGAPLLWVVLGRHVPWEWAWYGGRGDPRKAFRRLRRGGVSWRGLTVSYPTPAALAKILQPHFLARETRALGVVLPPSYAARWLDRSPRALALLTRAERALQRWPATSGIADHYIFEAQRSPA
jgi:SAM-dependent methyltransferase